jgi:hypothetical protein
VDPSVRIWFTDLAAMEGNARLPLAEASVDRHVHGRLHFEVLGRQLPYMGYFSPSDVCFGTWLTELQGVVDAFSGAEEARYVFDEGEQGQPAYVFERKGRVAYISIVDSEFSGGTADPEWHEVECAASDLISACLDVCRQFAGHLRSVAPTVADAWLGEHIGLRTGAS